VRLGQVTGVVLEQQRRTGGMATEMEHANLIAALTECFDHAVGRRVVDDGQHPEAGLDRRPDRLADRHAFIEQASQMTLVIDPVVGECEQDGEHRHSKGASRWRG
jgi:hypothetical protein